MSIKNTYFSFYNSVISISIIVLLGILEACNVNAPKFDGVIEQKYHSPLYIEDFTINETTNINFAKGIQIEFIINYPFLKGNLQKLFGESCNGYDLQLKILDRFGNNIMTNAIKMDTSKTNVFSEKRYRIKKSRKYSFFAPYYSLNLQAGRNDVYIEIKTFATFDEKAGSNNNTNNDLNNLKSSSDIPDMYLKIIRSINMPKINTIQVFVNHFTLDDTKFNPTECDTRFLGSGYPDPCWAITYDDMNLYYSDYITNELTYNIPSTSTKIYVADKDLIKLKIFDHDDLSRNDKLSEKFIDINEISSDTTKPSILSFDKIKNLKITILK